MNQGRFQLLVLGIIALIGLAIGIAAFRQSQTVSVVTPQTPSSTVTAQVQTDPSLNVGANTTGTVVIDPGQATSSPVVAPALAGQEIATSSVVLFGSEKLVSNIELSHRCIDGKMMTKSSEWNGKTYQFCIGKNQLVIREGGRELLVDELMVAQAKDAPILIKAELVTDSAQRQSSQILVSFSPEPCTTTGDCGLGMPNNHVTHVYSLETHAARRLVSFPKLTSGTAVWNAAFTKAIFYPVTCGGAGCTAMELMGYNLQTDFFTKAATTERAASLPEATDGAGVLSDASGNRLPYWSQIEWTTENDFRASITEPSERTRVIKGRI